MFVNLSGCLISSLIFLLIFLIIKELWWMIVGIAVILIAAYWGRRIYELLLENKANNEAKYNPEMGEVFKVCPYCNAKLKVAAAKCPFCKHELN